MRRDCQISDVNNVDVSDVSDVVDAFRALTPDPGRDVDTTALLDGLSERYAELLDLAAAVILVDDDAQDDGRLSVPAASAPRARLLAEYAVAADSGPSVDCARDGQPTGSRDLTAAPARDRWPQFGVGAEAAGYRAAHALPLHAHGRTFGSVTLLGSDPEPLTGPDARLARAMADTAATALGHHHTTRTLRQAETTIGQLESALRNRIVIEQAKGVLAARTGITPEDTFPVLRRYARNHNRRLPDVAREVIDGAVDLTADLTAATARTPQPRRPRRRVPADR